MHNQKKDNNKFKNKKQPELPENQTVWKSDNQGVKEETFTQTGRRSRDGQPGWRGLVTRRWTGQFHNCINQEDKPGGTTGERDRLSNSAKGNKASKPLTENTCGVVAAGETPSLAGGFTGETHRVLECTQTHPPRNQHQKVPVCLWEVGEMTESCQEPSKQHCSLLDPSPTYSITTQRSGLPHPGEYLRLCLLQWNRCAETKKYDPNERTHHNYRKKTKQ